jgi:hypothetical protein
MAIRLGRVLIGGMLALLVGCGDANIFSGDDSTPQAKLDRAVMSLDSGDWDNSIYLLEQLDQNDPEVQKYLASAYVGKAGFDTLKMIQIFAEHEEGGGSGEILFDAVLSIFAEKGLIHNSRDKTENLARAIDILEDRAEDALAQAGSPSDRARNARLVQRGTYAAVQTVLMIVQLLDDSNPIDKGLLTGMSDQAIEDQVTLIKFNVAQQSLETNLRIINSAVAALSGEKNEIKAQFAKFLTKIGFDDKLLTRNDLITYLKIAL